MGWRSKLDKARRLHRPSLRNWERDGLYEPFRQYVDTVLRAGDYQALLLKGVSHPEGIPVVLDGRSVDIEFFQTTFEARGIPCVLTHIPQNEGWRAVDDWDLVVLENDPELRERYFKCGEDDDGKSVKVKLKHFIKYLRSNRDDSPLYIFDSGFDEDRVARRILTDYKVPSFFQDDLFRLVSESRRPPYRWFLIGPERSGTCVHIDPLATSAWNTLIYGKKRWVLFPPHVPKNIVKGKGYVRKGEDDEAIHYFMYILPRIKRHAQQVGNRDEFVDFACYEFTQNAGETVFIPNGWWHAVLNLTHTVGVTQNFCSPRNFDKVWRKTRSGRKLMASKWLCQLDIHYPELGAQARELNRRDSYVMKYDPEEVRRKDEAKQQQRQQRRRHHRRMSGSGVSHSTASKLSQKSRQDVSPSSVLDLGPDQQRSERRHRHQHQQNTR